MFTGIVEEIGKVSKILGTNEAITLTIEASKVLEDVHLGDSIAVNGVCLTVTSFSSSSFTVDVMPETMKATSLKMIQQGSKVNLERAMAANGRFGGHFVSGHVDGMGEIVRKKREENAVYYDIKAPKELLNFMILKGSVAIDGTSLTIFGINDHHFTLSLIPHTMSESIIGEKEIGDVVNIECDMIAKYIKKYVTEPNAEEARSPITKEFLLKNGF
ncbi:riboflavin synthase [Bacillus kexueae]|uniref:riboflavin synthase n=1 Tax=Aeribacillus kexueae TaxID=2078952 RepID=UPI001FAFCC1E|nr:riboflavin synthase [Bacillus kexueae]